MEKKKISSLRFAYSVKFFEEGFRKRWNLGEYNPNEPTVFVGCYSSSDLAAIASHKGNKIVFLLGGDLGNFEYLKNVFGITFASDKMQIINLYKKAGVRHIEKPIPLKDFSAFKPSTPTDNKIYCYVNQGTPSHLAKHGVNSIKNVIEHFGADAFIFGTHGKTTEQVISDYYKPAFINLQLNVYAGFTSSLEMAHMGRKTISNTKAPFCIPYKSESDIISIIEFEFEFDAPVDFDLIGDYLMEDDSWLCL